MNLLEAGIPYIGCSDKLGTHKPIIDKYNTLNPLPRKYKMKYTDYWCMAGMSAFALMAGAPKRFPYECSCREAVELLKKENLWIENDAYIPDANDLIFYHWGEDAKPDCTSSPNHVGCVAYSTDSFIRVLECNFNGRVAWRDIPVDYKYIRGFGFTSTLWSGAIADYDINLIAHQVIAGKWGVYPERKIALNLAGYDYSIVQAEVNRILEKENSIENDYDLKAIALEVIRGEWGNNPKRKVDLINKGYDYEAVMEIVNNYYQKGGKI